MEPPFWNYKKYYNCKSFEKADFVIGFIPLLHSHLGIRELIKMSIDANKITAGP